MAADPAGNFNTMCRTCARFTQAGYRKTIFDGDGLAHHIPDKLKNLPFAISPGDPLPQVICDECLYKLDVMSDFVGRARAADHYLRQVAGSGSVHIKVEPDISVLGVEGAAAAAASERSASQRPSEPAQGDKEQFSTKHHFLYQPDSDSDSVQVYKRRHKRKSKVERRTRKRRVVQEKKRVPRKQSTRRRGVFGRPAKLVYPFHPCSFCWVVFSTAEGLQRHQHEHAPVFECQMCAMNFRSPAQLEEHVRAGSHLPAGHRPRPWRCGECGKEAEVKYVMKRHMRCHTSERPFQCAQCGQFFKTSQCLYYHQRIHNKDCRFVCNFCGKEFVAKKNFENHVQAIHIREKQFTCHDCGKEFTYKAAMKRHYLEKHTVIEKPLLIVCEVCGKFFKDKRSLRKHVETHSKSLEERKVHACVICGERFTAKYTLKLHMGTHGVGNVEKKTYDCHICGKKLGSSNSMKNHLVVHSGVKSFVCELCGKAFAVNGTLQTHMRIHRGEKPYSCQVCQSSFTQRPSLILHLRNVHNIDGRIRTFPKTSSEPSHPSHAGPYLQMLH